MLGGKLKMLDSLGKCTFKFKESFRKRSDRKKLQGATCTLYTKFYDAVIVGNTKDMVEARCNHLQQSHHHFRDLPLAILEGF